MPYTTYTIPIIAEEALTLLNELKSLVENVKIPNVQRSDVKLKMGQIDIKDLSRKVGFIKTSLSTSSFFV